MSEETKPQDGNDTRFKRVRKSFLTSRISDADPEFEGMLDKSIEDFVRVKSGAFTRSTRKFETFGYGMIYDIVFAKIMKYLAQKQVNEIPLVAFGQEDIYTLLHIFSKLQEQMRIDSYEMKRTRFVKEYGDNEDDEEGYDITIYGIKIKIRLDSDNTYDLNHALEGLLGASDNIDDDDFRPKSVDSSEPVKIDEYDPEESTL